MFWFIQQLWILRHFEYILKNYTQILNEALSLPRLTWEDNIKMTLKDSGIWTCELESSGLGAGTNGIESSSFITTTVSFPNMTLLRIIVMDTSVKFYISLKFHLLYHWLSFGGNIIEARKWNWPRTTVRHVSHLYNLRKQICGTGPFCSVSSLQLVTKFCGLYMKPEATSALSQKTRIWAYPNPAKSSSHVRTIFILG